MKRTIVTYKKCSACGKTICKRKAEINRQIRNGKTKFYCNNRCAGKINCQHLQKYQDNFKKTKYIRQPDKYSNFRWYIKSVKARKNKEYNIDCEYLKELWEKQGGICPITKKKLELRTHSYENKSQPYSASLDRIDNSKGYIKGNVRFVALIFNYARNKFEDDQVLEFCKAVASEN
jgi:hypothetical protein